MQTTITLRGIQIIHQLIERHEELKNPDTKQYGQDEQIARLIDNLKAESIHVISFEDNL